MRHTETMTIFHREGWREVFFVDFLDFGFRLSFLGGGEVLDEAEDGVRFLFSSDVLG